MSAQIPVSDGTETTLQIRHLLQVFFGGLGLAELFSARTFVIFTDMMYPILVCRDFLSTCNGMHLYVDRPARSVFAHHVAELNRALSRKLELAEYAKLGGGGAQDTCEIEAQK